MQKCISENARVVIDQSEYNERYNGLAERYSIAKTRFYEVSAAIYDKRLRLNLVEGFITELAKQDGLIAEFDEKLWCSLLNFAMVGSDGEIVFTFKNGTEIGV